MGSKGKVLSVVVLLAALAIYSCKDSDDSPEPKKTEVLCDGDGSKSYWPIDSGRVWSYTFKKEGVADAVISHFEIKNSVVFSGNTYLTVVNKESTIWGTDNYLREDPVTHDILNFKSSNGKDYLEVPGNPVLGQKWNYSFWSREVTSLNASFKSENCNYTGLLEVTEWDGGSVKKMLYYKKGLGLVHQWYPPYNDGNPKVEFILNDVNFK